MNIKNHDTPTKAKVQGAVEFYQKMGLPFFKKDVFRTFNVEHRRGHEFLKPEFFARRHHNISNESENRGRPRIISTNQIREMERILEEEGMKGRALTWEQLSYEIGLECNDKTVQKAMSTMKYHKCIACKKGWVNESTAKKRVEWASQKLKDYSESED